MTARRLLEQLWLPAALVVLWWFGSAGSESIYFPPLADIVGALVEGLSEGELVAHSAYSLRNLAAGMLIAIGVGVLAGLVIGEVELLRRAIDPILQFGRAIPQVAIVPIVIGVLGIGAAPKVYVIAFACVWPILLNTIDGVRGLDPAVREVATAFRIPPLLRFRRVVLRAAMPQIVAGVRVALSIGVVVMVVSELFGADRGLGYFILQSGRGFAVPETWAGTLLVGAIGYLLSAGFLLFERAVLGWYFASAAGSQRQTRRAKSANRKVTTP